MLFEVNAQSFLVRLVIREAGGITTEFRFGNWEEDSSIPESDFHLFFRPGVTVVDERLWPTQFIDFLFPKRTNIFSGAFAWRTIPPISAFF